MPTIGETLKAAREARGLSLPEAGQATRIKTQQLDALERDDYRTIPAAPYARGFIKLYAQFLHLDPVPLLEQYNIRHGKSVPPPAPTPTTTARPRPAAPAKTAPASAAPVHAPAAGQDRVVPASVPAALPPEVPAAVVTEPEPVREAYVPILPVAGVTSAPSPAARPDELPLLDAPVAAASGPGPLIPEDQPAQAAPAEVATPVFPAFPAPATAAAPASEPSIPVSPGDPEPERLELSAPPIERIQRDVEGAVEVVERSAPPSAADDRIEAARRADRQLRLRQAMLVVVAVLVFAGVLWLIRKLVRDAAPDASELSGMNARSRGLVAPPPEPYLEGR